MNAFCGTYDTSLIDLSIQVFRSLVLKINQCMHYFCSLNMMLRSNPQGSIKGKFMHVCSISREPSMVLNYEIQGKV